MALVSSTRTTYGLLLRVVKLIEVEFSTLWYLYLGGVLRFDKVFYLYLGKVFHEVEFCRGFYLY